MKNTKFIRVLAFVIASVMLIGMLPVVPFAASVDYVEDEDGYYKLISKDDYELAPGIVESEIVLNNASGTHRQVAHVVEVDINNPYTKVMPSYKGMAEGLAAKNYGVQIMSEQAAYAEANGYGNVVAAMNLSLSWYDSAYYQEHPELIGEPLAYMILDGVQYTNSQGQTSGSQTCLVINFDEKDGVARPSDIPKTEIRSTSSAITGWEEQVIPANFGYLVKDGVNQNSVDNNGANGASRSFVGIKEDGTIVMVMNDGRQAPYSTGFTNYEMAEFMLSLGCVQAINGDGGGSSAFLSQRPGEELKINCSPSDGAERPTTHGILVITTAPATGEFVRANISTEYEYYAPGSTVKFNVLGTDAVGNQADIPADVTWQLADDSFGAIDANGVFTSNGKEGTATVQMVYQGEVVGEHSVEIVMPETFSFSQKNVVVPLNATVTIGLKATANGGLHTVAFDADLVELTLDNTTLGTLNGLVFTSVASDEGLTSLEGKLTASLKGTEFSATAKLKLGAPSEVLFDFEEEEDIDGWKTGVVNGYHESGFKAEISYADTANGEVHNGSGALRLETNGLSDVNVSSGGYAQVPIYLKDGVIVKEALSIGFWAYIPDEYEHCWIRVLYWYDSNGDGTYDKKNTVTVINQPEVYDTWDESGWKYFEVDVSAYDSILIPGVNDADTIFPAANHPNKGAALEPNDYRFIEFMFPHTNTNTLWKTYGTINGPFTIYVDNITADYSEAVDDREAPVFKDVTLLGSNESETVLEKYNTVVTTSNILNVKTRVAEDTTKTTATGLDVTSAKAYIDGVEVAVTYSNGNMSISDIAVADGVHRIKFEIADNAGNKAVVIRLVKVASGEAASTIELVPADPTLDRLYGGSVYWMDLNATMIETIHKVSTVIDLNSTNHWELDHMVVAEGFTGEYTIDEETNTATITITRTGENQQTGAATLASLPIRVIYYDTDIKIEGYTAETYWTTYDFWPYDLKVDVDYGEITYVQGYSSNVLNAFSNEEFSVDVEMYTSSANMDATFKAERGTAHVHTAESVDIAATCSTMGYTGGTYCKICASPVEWGTTIAKTAHEYAVNEEDKLSCVTCGELFSGVHTDGKTYVDGVVMADGWSGESYYKDGVMYTGVKVIDGKYYNFGEDGICPNKYPMSAEWWTNEKGESYYFDSGVPMTEYSLINGVPTFFDENGVAFQGEIEINGETCVFEKGVFVESTTAEVRLAGRAGSNAYFVLYTNGTFVLCGEGATYDYVSTGYTYLPNLSWKNRPWGRDSDVSRSIIKVVVGKDITSLGDYTFRECYNIAEVTFEEGSKLTQIKQQAFVWASALKEIRIPEGVKSMGHTALGQAANLTNVYLPKSLSDIHAEAFEGSANAVLNVAEGSYAEQFAKNYSVAYTYTHRILSGTITSVIGEDDDILVQLIPEGASNVAYETVVKGLSAVYSLEDVAVGSYTMKVTKANHVIATCTVTVSDENAAQDVTLVLGSSDQQFKINSAYLVLSKDINVIYRATLPEGFTNPRMVFTFNDEETVVTTYTVDAQGRYCYEFSNVNPQKMGDNISATLYATVDGTEVSVSVLEYSVRQYCINQLTNNPDDANLKRMISDLLVYGAKTQVYQNYEVDALVTDGLDLTPSTFTSLDDSYNKQAVTGTSDPNIRYSSAKLQLSNDMIVLLGISTEDPTPYTFEVTINGNTTVYTSEDLTYQNGKYYLSFEGVKATQFNDVITAVIKKDGVQISQTLNYSVNTYIQKNQNTDDEALRELLKAIYNYGESSKLYAN